MNTELALANNGVGEWNFAYSRATALQAFLTALGLSGNQAEEATSHLLEIKRRPIPRNLQRQEFPKKISCAIRVFRFVTKGTCFRPLALLRRIAKVQRAKTRSLRMIVVRQTIRNQCGVCDKTIPNPLMGEVVEILYGDGQDRTASSLYDSLIRLWKASGNTLNIAVMSHRLRGTLDRLAREEAEQFSELHAEPARLPAPTRLLITHRSA